MKVDIGLLERLCACFSPSGHEKRIAALIRSELSGFADEIYEDALGNLIARRRGAGKKLMFSAHMDSVGLIVTNIDGGMLYFSAIGGVSPYLMLGGHVVFESELRGVVMCGAKVKRSELRLSDMFIDIGAADDEAAGKLVSPGDVCVLAPQFFVQSGRIFSPCLDNRIGCLALIEAAKRLKATENDVYFAFTVQEELGLRGAKTAVYPIAPDFAFSVDVTGTYDVPDSPHGNVVLGGGAAIKVKDASVIAHRDALIHLRGAAEARGIKHQLEVSVSGGTDGGAIHQSGAGVRTGGISIPSRYIHSACECVEISDVEAAAELVLAAAQESLAGGD